LEKMHKLNQKSRLLLRNEGMIGFFSINSAGYCYIADSIDEAVYLKLEISSGNYYFVVCGGQYDGYYLGFDLGGSQLYATSKWNVARYVHLDDKRIIMLISWSNDRVQWQGPTEKIKDFIIDISGNTKYKALNYVAYDLLDKMVTVDTKVIWIFQKRIESMETKETFAKKVQNFRYTGEYSLETHTTMVLKSDLPVSALMCNASAESSVKATTSHNIEKGFSSEDYVKINTAITEPSELWLKVTRNIMGDYSFDVIQDSAVVKKGSNPGMSKETLVSEDGKNFYKWEEYEKNYKY